MRPDLVSDLAVDPGGPHSYDRQTGPGMDESAFDEFYALSYRRLVGQIYAMCGNLAEAQDCVQEAFVRAWDKRRRLDVDQYPEAWVRTVAEDQRELKIGVFPISSQGALQHRQGLLGR